MGELLRKMLPTPVTKNWSKLSSFQIFFSTLHQRKMILKNMLSSNDPLTYIKVMYVQHSNNESNDVNNLGVKEQISHLFVSSSLFSEDFLGIQPAPIAIYLLYSHLIFFSFRSIYINFWHVFVSRSSYIACYQGRIQEISQGRENIFIQSSQMNY